jgi:hypothetical protein
MTKPNFLYELLPTIYRQTDLARDTPLLALFTILQEQYDVLEGDIATLYDNWFVETCEPWALPYLAELLGADRAPRHEVGGIGSRRLIANTLAYRRRNGTVATIEHVVEDATGWAARIVEGSDLVAMTETCRRLGVHARGTASMRDTATLDQLGGPFDGAGRTAQVGTNGLCNLDRVGIFLWRLQSYPMRSVTAAKAAGGEGRYTFHPLGRDMPLFNRRLGNYGIDRRNGMRNVPAPLSRRVLSDELDHRAAAEPAEDGFFLERAPAFAVYLRDGACTKVPPERLCIGDLSHWRPGVVPSGARVLVDPERGRLMLLHEQDRRPGTRVMTDHCYGFAGDVGGGPYFQPAAAFPAASPPWRARVGGYPDSAETAVGHFTSLKDAIGAWPGTDTEGVIEIADSGTYFLGNGDGDESQLNIKLEKTRRRLVIQAAPQQRPCLEGTLLIEAENVSNAAVTLDGLLIGGAVHATGAMHLTLRHCTIIPSHGQIGIRADSNGNEGLLVVLQSVMTAAVRVSADAGELRISDSIVDGGNLRAIAASEEAADSDDEDQGELRLAGPPAKLERATIIGRVVVAEIAASDTIFTAPLTVTRRHQGFVRHCYVSEGSRTPRRYECQPDDPSAGESGGVVNPVVRPQVRPRFTSLQFGHPGYAQLAATCPQEILAGASNGAAMGAFHYIGDIRREHNLRDMLDEHLPVGFRPITIYVT